MVCSFNEWADIGIRIVQEKFSDISLLEVRGISSELISDPADFTEMEVLFWYRECEAIIIRSKNPGEFYEPELLPDPYDGSFFIDWPIKMELKEAHQLKEAAGFTDPYTRVTLRHMSHPNIHPCFIFNSTHSGFIFVDIFTKKVSQETPPANEE